MTARFNRQDRVHVFNCDGTGCHKNFEGEEGDDFRGAWAQARASGWVNTEYRGTWKHFCPTHARELGD